jgi:signal transduction histidine kinase/CheY-like chemotaxis protein
LVQPSVFGHDEAAVLIGVIERISRAESAAEIYEPSLDAIMSALRAERASILLFDPDGVMRFKAWRGISDAYRAAVEGHTPWKPEDGDAVPFVVADTRDDPSLAAYAAAFAAEKIAGLAFIPIVASRRVIGKFMLYFDSPTTPSSEELRLGQAIASQVAHAAARVTLHEAERRTRMWLERLHEIIAALSSAVSVQEFATLTTWRACEVLGLASTAVWLVDAAGDLALLATHGTPVASASRWNRIAKDAKEPPSEAARTGRALWIETDEAHRLVMEGAAGDGEPRVRSYALLPLRVHDTVLGVIGFSREKAQVFDTDERRYLETLTAHAAQGLERARLFEAERRARTDAETANRAKDQFLATMSHELRTPLNAISGWVQMLRSGTLPPERRAHAIQVIERNARIQEQLIGDLLDMSRVISGRLRLEVERIDVAEIVRSALDSIRPTAEAKQVEIEAHIDAADLVRGDGSRLQQIAWNLLTNAVKFTPEGGRVRVSLTEETPNVVLSIRDSGQGIPEAFLPHIFEPFRQADGSYGRVHGGLGLGLAITRTLVEMHGGTIEVRSEGEGRGAEFVVRLPVESLRPESTERIPTLQPASVRPPAAPRDLLADARILVVEDEPDSRELRLSLLEAYGAKTFGAATAAEALEKLGLARPDIIVSDVGLPGEDGLSLMRRIRAMPGPRVPAVALTAFSRPEDRERTAAAGFDLHIGKPIDPERLIEHLRRLRRPSGATP